MIGLTLLVISFLCGTYKESACGDVNRKNYSMYVWTRGFDRSVSGCDVREFLKWDSHGKCFTHVWDTPEKRQWLWNTCNLPGREISAIYLSDVHRNLKYAKDHVTCHTDDVIRVRQTLKEGHTKVPGLKIYGLYAVSDLDVSEKDLVQYIVYYNDHCAVTPDERFDGVAVNNEAYAKIKCGPMGPRLEYLDNLKKIAEAAKLQRNGTLLTHYSVSWHWSLCNGKPSLMTWNHKTNDVSHHMIDIFDSIDVQVGYITLPATKDIMMTAGPVVGYITFPAIKDRMMTAGYDYAQQLGKTIYTTFYTDKTSPCQITFFPADTCRVHGHSERAMYDVIDKFADNGLGYARPCIHFFRGVYSSGGHPDWPAHEQEPSVIIG